MAVDWQVVCYGTPVHLYCSTAVQSAFIKSSTTGQICINLEIHCQFGSTKLEYIYVYIYVYVYHICMYLSNILKNILNWFIGQINSISTRVFTRVKNVYLVTTALLIVWPLALGGTPPLGRGTWPLYPGSWAPRRPAAAATFRPSYNRQLWINL